MKFSADFVCQFCWRIDYRADERQDTGEILENGRDLSDLELIISNVFYLVGWRITSR